MQRTVSAHLELEIAGESNLVFGIAASRSFYTSTESLSFVLDGVSLEAEEVIDRHGSRLHQLAAGPGRMLVDYRAVIEGQAPPAPVDPLDQIIYLRPSRYCESDSLLPTARAEFWGLSGHVLLTAVTTWVHDHLSYVPGSSLPTDGALRTLTARRGVCRDYAHLVIALLRALDVPARMVAVYAPGLDPMDFHAVAEAFVDGKWWVVDATRLAPRQSLIRISTGRDAADIAFLTNNWADVALLDMEVLAIVDELPYDDNSALYELS